MTDLMTEYGPFDNGVAIRGMPVLSAHGGKVFWVHSGGSDGNPGTFDRPLATIDAAVNKCQANRGDVIMVKPGHAETIAAAAGIDLDVAGVSVVGLGSGTDMPEVTIATATTADIDIDAANVTIKGIRFICAIDSMVAGIDVNADDCTIQGCEFYENSATGLVWIDINGGASNAADRARIIGNRFVCTTAANWDAAIELGEVADHVEIIGNSIVGDFDDACIHNPTGKVLTNLLIKDNYLRQNQTGDHAIELVSACTGAMIRNWLVTDAIATAVDQGSLMAADNWFSNSSSADTAATPYPVTGTTGAVGIDQVTDALYGANGVVTYPAAAAAANAVSIAEVLRYVQDRVAGAMLNRNSTNYLAVTADFTSATWNTAASHEILTVTGACHIIILPEVTGAPTSAGSGATLVLGDETTSNSIIASTDAENLATAEWWFDATDTRTLAARSIFEKTDVVVTGKDIGYTIGTEALTGGSIVFHVWWEPIGATGAVVAGAGGAL